MLERFKALIRRPDLYTITKEDLYSAERELHTAQNNLANATAMRDLQQAHVFRLSSKLETLSNV